MNTIYSKKQFKIYKMNKGFIVHNSRKVFCNGHSHINNFNTAVYIINLALNYSVPDNHINDYLLDSIIRISTNKSYIEKIERKKINKNKHIND